MDMRKFIDVVEARGPKMVAPKDRTAEYQALYNKAKEMSGKYNIPVAARPWQKDWTNAVNAEFNRLKKNHYEFEQSEKKDNEEDGKSYEIRKLNGQETLEEAISGWWQKNRYNIIEEAKQALRHTENQYFEYHPNVEDSDPIRLFGAEKSFITHLYLSSLDTIDGMNSFLDHLDYFLAVSFGSSSDMSWGECTNEMANIISNGIPLILWYTKSMINFSMVTR